MRKGKDSLNTKRFGEKWISMYNKNVLILHNSQTHPFPTPSWIKKLNVRFETVILPGENAGGNSHAFGLAMISSA